MGYATMGFRRGERRDRAEEAAKWRSPSAAGRYRPVRCTWCAGYITAGFDLRLDEFETVGNTIRALLRIMRRGYRYVLIPEMNDELRVTVVATGIGMDNVRKSRW
ncbi:hypothetical protein ACNKHW_00640 [Shigella flexneri]